MKMQCELLGGISPVESTTASVTDFIKSMVGGKAAHRAGALKLALRNGRPTGPPVDYTFVPEHFYGNDYY